MLIVTALFKIYLPWGPLEGGAESFTLGFWEPMVKHLCDLEF